MLNQKGKKPVRNNPKNNPDEPINEDKCRFFLVQGLCYNGLEHQALYQKCTEVTTESKGPIQPPTSKPPQRKKRLRYL